VGGAGVTEGLAHSPVKTRQQAEFLFRSVRERAGHFPYAHTAPSVLEHMVRREIVQGATARYVHPEADPGSFMGCFVIRPGKVVHAYMKEPFQAQGIMSAALSEYGIRFEMPTPVLIWSAAASRIAEKGYRIYPAIPVPHGRHR
jgi:hypothetical protein